MGKRGDWTNNDAAQWRMQQKEKKKKAQEDASAARPLRDAPDARPLKAEGDRHTAEDMRSRLVEQEVRRQLEMERHAHVAEDLRSRLIEREAIHHGRALTMTLANRASLMLSEKRLNDQIDAAQQFYFSTFQHSFRVVRRQFQFMLARHNLPKNAEVITNIYKLPAS